MWDATTAETGQSCRMAKACAKMPAVRSQMERVMTLLRPTRSESSPPSAWPTAMRSVHMDRSRPVVPMGTPRSLLR
jgi:hypothetical protein